MFFILSRTTARDAKPLQRRVREPRSGGRRRARTHGRSELLPAGLPSAILRVTLLKAGSFG